MDKDRQCTTTEPGTNINVPSKKIVTLLPPLTDPLPDTENVQYANTTTTRTGAQVTTLSNGLRVASEQRFGQFCTVGVVIDSGPRYEVAYPSGVSHFLEKLAFHVRRLLIESQLQINHHLPPFSLPWASRKRTKSSGNWKNTEESATVRAPATLSFMQRARIAVDSSQSLASWPTWSCDRCCRIRRWIWPNKQCSSNWSR